jgi:hypothetical protein
MVYYAYECSITLLVALFVDYVAGKMATCLKPHVVSLAGLLANL